MISGFSFRELRSQIDEWPLVMNLRLGRAISDVRSPPMEEKTWVMQVAYSFSSKLRYSQILLPRLLTLFFIFAAFIFLWVEAIALALE